MIEFADAAARRSRLIAALCPDLSVPKAGGLRDLMQALELSRTGGDELPELEPLLRRTRSLDRPRPARATRPRRSLTCKRPTG